MAFSYACLTLQRVVLPIILVLAALYRPVGISFVYLLMFFISPFVPVATKKNFKGSVTPYFIILIALSTILVLCHIGLQVSILALDIGDSFGTCTVIERLLRHVGFIGFQNLKIFAVIEWLVPEVAVFISSIVVYVVTKKITQKVEVQIENGNGDAVDLEEILDTGATVSAGNMSARKSNDIETTNGKLDSDKPNFDGLIKISPLFCLATLFFSATLRPSVPGGFYFLIFLLSGSYWATFQTLQRKFAILLRFVMVVIVAHTICIVAYQTPWMQDHLDENSLAARLIGLEPLVTSSCANGNDIRIIVYDTKFKADSFLNPIVLFFTYYALALTTKNLIKARIIAKPATAFGHEVDNSSTHKIQRQISLITQTSRSSKKDGTRSKSQRLNVTLRREQQRPQIIIEPTETTPLMRSATRKITTNATSTTDNNGGTDGQQTNNDIPLDSLDNNRQSESEYKSGICDQIWYGITGIGGFIYQNSYIFTNVLMMAWSIVYHSWLTFVLLLWANVLWMIPNQRKAMMRSSPFIVIYAELLLIAQYIYGMDLTNDELPSHVGISGINLQQIGFERPQENDMQPCIPLIVKTSFLLMFWVTLRQFFKEKTDKRRDSNLADIFAPLQLSVSHSITEQSTVGGKKTSKFLKKMGIVIKNLLVRLWIWLLVLVIFLCAMTGDKMTGFRICYMALFLFFLLVFQSSSKAWVKLMYGFWLFLIFYAMSILILIYTYQFDEFDKYWVKYLNISTTLQTDIGLELYKTKDLFLHLVSPTIIVILTVIQVHYFHKRFIASINQPTEATSRLADDHVRHKSRTYSRVTESEGMEFVESAGNLIKLFLIRCRNKAEVFFKNFKGVFWRLLELHWIKVVYLTAFICAVSEVSLLHVPFIALCVVGVVSNVRMNFFFSRLISLMVTIIVLSKMIYQIAYLDHSKYDFKCPDANGKYKGNNAEWFGLYKASPEYGLMGLLKIYIIYMVIATLHAVISLRQYQMRRLKGTLNDPVPKVAFPDVGREHAEKKLEGMIKYLINYGFYKFGYEICLIALVSTITYRQDIVAVAYSVWLILLLLFKRSKNAHIWGILQVFILVSILVQYVILVEFPPSMCVEYVWINTKYSEPLQRWAMLPGDLHYDHTKKLIFDFVFLLLVNRQKRVFTLENLPNYPGGSNKSVIKDIANLGKVEFENPTHDFLSHIRNYLDIFKHAVLCGFYWVSLAVVFLAGTNISDFLAIGYLIGAFMFLWEGSDFYLRPIKSITTRWTWLLTYNVANIVIKTGLQMIGCLFMDTLQVNCCWAVHLFGISCSSKDIVLDLTEETTNECPAITVQSVLLWDAICFAFLIFQLRIFKSHYFCHIITDTRANNILASRGAEIIERLRQKQIDKRQEYEEEVLHKIKRKMEKIRATQQKMLRPLEKPTHFDASKSAPLAHCNSFTSCTGSGYHTPEDENNRNNTASTASITSCSSNNGSVDDLSKVYINIQDSDIKSISDYGDNMNKNTKYFMNLPEIAIEPHTQPMTPTSDGLTIPLEGFLEAPRLSVYSHQTNSDLSQPKYDISEGSNEVFYANNKQPKPSPLLLSARTLQADVARSRNSSIISSNMAAERISSLSTRTHRRQSSVNAVSWNETVSIKCPTPSKPQPQKPEELHVIMRKKLLHRRHQSVGNAKYSVDDSTQKRRDSNRRLSNLSWAQEEALMRYSKRPNSWGPVEHGNPVYSSRPHKRKEIKLHPHAVRAGDYYMFEDVDDKFELEVITDAEGLFDADNENITESEIKMSRRKTLYDVWKDISNVQYRRQIYLRQRSYASAPPSHIDLLFDEQQHIVGDLDACIGNRISTLSEPLCYPRRSTSEYFESQKPKSIKETQTDVGPSTSKVGSDIPSRAHEAKPRTEVDSGDTADDSDADFDANPIVRLMEAFLVSLTIRLNRFSRNYRYVNKILAEEKKALKESNNLFMLKGRFSTKNAASLFSIMKRNIASSCDESEDAAAPSASSKRNSNNALNNIIITNIQEPPQNNHNTYEPIMQSPNPPQPPPPPQLPTSPQPPLPTTATNSTIQSSDIQQYNDEAIESVDVVDARSKESIVDRNSKMLRGRKSEPLPEIRIKAPSFDRGHRGSGSIISKQWSQEKVTSTEIAFDDEDFTARDHNIIIEVLISAWYAILSNTDLICYIVVFINQVVNASLISLPLPLMVFLWGTLSLPRPTKTFWVTLIAYTQAIVLIKCIFQFKLIWVNYHFNLPNNPLGVDKLFGIEMSSDYATYDLLLLLVLFFHRFILKSHGLWKIDMYKPIVVYEGYGSKSTLNDSNPDDSNDPNDANDERRQSGGSEHGSEQRLTAGNELAKHVENLQRNKYLSGLTKFFHNLVYKARLPTDVYALMFLCDFINFFVLLFGFTAFSSKQGDGGVKTYLAENKVPIPFLIMLLVQFALIVIDRALYLRKALVYKIIFHFISVVGIHVWMFFIVPAVTERSFYSSAPPIIFYIIKCFYLLLSSYQIKCGYPNRILGNFLTKSFSMINMISFKIYMLIPFLYELRTILDWLCTDTTMTLFDWLKMEDIFANTYSIKCIRQMETDFPAVRAQKKATYLKLLMGGSAILLIVFALWGPLTLFALSGAVGQSNVPTEVKVSIRIGSYDPIYEASTRESTFIFDDAMFDALKKPYIENKEKEAISFLLSYDASDVAAIKLKRNSPSMWNISPPDKQRLLSELESNVPLVVRLSYELTRTPPVKNQVGTVGSEITWEMPNDYEGRKNLAYMIKTGNADDIDATIPNIVPKFIKVLNSGDPTYITALLPKVNNNTMHSDFTNMSLSMNSASDAGLWWEITDECVEETNKEKSNAVTNLLKKLPLYNCSEGIVFYTFNDKKFPSTWTFLTGGGIIGLYTTFVLLASRFLKNFLGGQTRRIMYEDVPNVDRVLQLCLDIYLVREALEFMLEEDLFAKLIFLYRSPETMIKWTRPREEIADDETDSDSVRSRMSGRRGDHPQPANIQQS